jgi:putative transposase
MSRKYRFGNQDYLHFITCTVIDWIDAFTRNEYRQVIVNSIKHCQEKKGLEIYGYVIMPSHIHLIIGRNGIPDMEDIVRDMKSFTSRKIRELICDRDRVFESRREWLVEMMQRAGKNNSNNHDYQFCIQDNKPIEIYSKEVFEQKLEYIHLNPVKDGYVEHPEHWYYSSARNYAELKGVIDILYT